MQKPSLFFKNIRYSLDALVVFLSYFLTAYAFNDGNVPLISPVFYIVAIGLWWSMSLFSKLYSDRRSNKFSEEIVFIIYHSILFAVSLSSMLFFLSLNHKYSSPFIIVFVSSCSFLAIATKYALRKKIHSALYHGAYFDQVLLIGNNQVAENFIDTVHKYYYYGYQCAGYIAEQPSIQNEVQYFGQFDQLQQVLSSNKINEVFIALSNKESKQIQECIRICDNNNVRVRMLPDLTDFTTSSVFIQNIGQLPVVNIGSLPLDKKEHKLAKRIFDILFSGLFFLTIGIFIFPIIAIIIKLTSRGPIIFKQERWGLNNEKITCFKFRSMIKESSDIDEGGNYNQAHKNDPRITLIGKFLRQTNLDELPQFWNVLLGNMSVVGPRPHPTPLNIESMQTVDNYMLRHQVLPGITGLAQVNGCRGETKTTQEMQRRVNFDLYYIHRWSFWLDLQIIIQTVVNIFRGDQNAY
jgi:putative colanic acid biosynthesis UDP-glucose lipid carrier transferase